jgi:PAS domain S-box-containing protein
LQFQRSSAEDLANQFAAIVDASEDAIIGRNPSGIVTSWNRAAEQLFGYRGEEIIGQSSLLLLPPDFYEADVADLNQLRQGHALPRREMQWIRKGGQRLDLSVVISPLHDPSGHFIGSVAIVSELASRSLYGSARARLAAIVESSDDAIVAKDLNGVVTDWNAAAERMFGYTADEILGRSILTIIPPELQHEEPAVLDRIRAGDRIQHFPTQRLHKSGKRLDVSLTVSPIRDAAGKVIGASKIARDVSDERRAHQARLMLAAIVESSDDAIISKNLDGIITSWNAAAERLFGYTPEEIIGHSVLRLIPRELHKEEPVILGKLRKGERVHHFETRRMKKNGQIIDISLTVSPIKDDNGRVIGGSKIVRDISERKAAEIALIEKEKLAATGRLAATLAHEVNNPLESIMNLSFIIAHDEHLPRSLAPYAEMLLKEVQRAGDITRQTLGYYRNAKLSGEVDVVETIQHVIGAKQKKLNEKRIKVETEFKSSIPVIGYAGELRQVFENLIENAIDALSEGGKLRVRTHLQGTPGAERIAVSICDTGTGIPTSVRGKLFEPFFTTKGNGGSGVGLWVSRSLVHKHGGWIRVRSSQSPDRHGSVFTVVIPVSLDVSSEQSQNAVMHVA